MPHNREDYYKIFGGCFLGSSAGQEFICNAGDSSSWVGKFPWRRDRLLTPVFLSFPGGSDGKESAYKYERPGFNPWVGKIPWRRKWQPTPIFLLGESMDRGAWWATVQEFPKSGT